MPKGGKGKPAGGYRAGEKGSYGCNGYPTVSADGTVHGCHPTRAAAANQARAIWAATTKKSMNLNVDYFSKSSCKEGDFVIASIEDDMIVGIVQFVMTEGTLGLESSEYALTATPDDSVMLVRKLEFDEEDGWEETEYMIGAMHSSLTKIQPLTMESNEEVVSETDMQMAAYDASIGKADGYKGCGCPTCKELNVDCPNCPVCSKEMNSEKRDYSTASRERMSESGNAMPDGSFPIANRADLMNAIRSVGRAKDYEKAKAHIIRRAKELNAIDMLPESWNNLARKGMTGWGGTVFDLNNIVK